jgi:hypothetical protein
LYDFDELLEVIITQLLEVEGLDGATIAAGDLTDHDVTLSEHLLTEEDSHSGILLGKSELGSTKGHTTMLHSGFPGIPGSLVISDHVLKRPDADAQNACSLSIRTLKTG